MPDQASLTASVARPIRYEVREELWGSHKRFVVSDTATNTTIAIRATSQNADSDLIRLNWAAPGDPEPGPARQPAATHAPPELTPARLPQRQCGRCRQLFPCDPVLNPAAIQDWWTCEPCHDKLMGGGGPTGTGPVGATAPARHLRR